MLCVPVRAECIFDFAVRERKISASCISELKQVNDRDHGAWLCIETSKRLISRKCLPVVQATTNGLSCKFDCEPVIAHVRFDLSKADGFTRIREHIARFLACTPMKY